jgi:hypothetical protein
MRTQGDSVANAKMQFILKGFSQDMGLRTFAFEGIGVDRTRTAFTVGTDLALSRRYGIRLQELPLLCRGILERRDEAEETRAFTFTEADMYHQAHVCATAREGAAHRRKPPRRPATDELGAASQVPPR